MAVFSPISELERARGRERVRTDPVFLRMISRTFWVFLALLTLSAWFWYQPPLEPPADPASPPNPAKSAWFLLWIQELVSHSVLWVYPILGLGVFLWLLPRIGKTPEKRTARWFPKEGWPLWAFVAVMAVSMVALTLYAAFFRGENWQSTLEF